MATKRNRAVGFTGARFQRVAIDPDQTDTDRANPDPADPGRANPRQAGAEQPGTRRVGVAHADAAPADLPQPEPFAPAGPSARPGPFALTDPPDPPAELGHPSRPALCTEPVDPDRIRPYVITGGRTRVRTQLPIETLIISGSAVPHGLSTAHRAILDMCRTPLSVAEVSARLGIPFGVARVLVDDLLGARAAQVHGSPTGGAHGHDATLLRDVRDRLLRL